MKYTLLFIMMFSLGLSTQSCTSEPKTDVKGSTESSKSDSTKTKTDSTTVDSTASKK